MEGNIAATYTLIYRFLKQQSQHKAAEAVKKAAKAIVVLRDDVAQGPPLEDIIREWKAKENTKSGNAASSSEDSDSSDDSEDSSNSDSSSEDTSGSESEGGDTSDGDDSSDDSDDSDEATIAKKLPQKVVGSDTSATLSSAGESAQEVAGQPVQTSKKPTKDTDKAIKDENRGSESDSSDPDSSDSESSSKRSTSDGTGSSSSSDSSDEDKANENEKVPPNKTKTSGDKGPSTSESSSESEDESDLGSQQKEDTRVAKKRKTLKNGAAVTTAVATGSQQITRISQRKEKPLPKVKERFQRVKVQDLAPELLLNNGYAARGGVANDYGERAHRDLIVTRGAGFRKEKNKKKRGSYRGGEITMENRSIKFYF